MITKYEQYCFICGTPASETHHLVFSKGMRPLADADELTAPICRKCHDAIHHGKEPLLTQTMSRIIGQMEYEKKQVAKGVTEDEARERFRARYGRSYL